MFQMLRRVMQAKQIGLFTGFVVIFCVYSFILFRRLTFFEGEIRRLDTAKGKLEIELAHVQLDNLERSRRLTSKDSDLVPAVSLTTNLYPSWHENEIIIYNRVPKTGSTSFAGVAYDLCGRNGYHVLRINVTRNHHVFSMTDQARFVQNVTRWSDKRPAMYHGHIAHIDFTKFGVSRPPVYINLLRDPIERLVSYYYFLRYGDDFIPNKKRRKSGDKRSFDDCIVDGDEDCSLDFMWKQIPFFCGMNAQCWIPGSQWALEEAKRSLINNYLVVGVTEEMSDFLAVLEATLPRFFRGATEKFASGGKSHLRKTNVKYPPSQVTVARIQESDIWKLENEFYLFAKEQFRFIKQNLFNIQNGVLIPKRQQFSFEKIRPR